MKWLYVRCLFSIYETALTFSYPSSIFHLPLFRLPLLFFCLCPVQSVTSPLQALQQRTWLIHWSLFVFFNHPKGRDNIIELFLYQPQ